jgi:hypothetical protein
MKPKGIREHFRTTDSGISWIPKKAFVSEEAIKDAKLYANKWHPYQCGYCDLFHVSKIWKVEAHDD